jgi:multiple sugar transport system ATP-binding protein
MNFIMARLEKQNGGHEVVFGNTRLALTQEEIGRAKERGYDPESFTGKDVILGIRPEHLEDAETEAAEAIGGSEGANTMDVEPQVIESMGSEKYLYFEVPREQAAHLESLGEMTDDETSEDENGGGSADESGDLMVARVAAESDAKEGQKRRVVIDGSQVQLFDPETEKAIF